MTIRESIEKLDSEEIAFKIISGYYSDDGLRTAHEVLASRGVRTDEQIKTLGLREKTEAYNANQQRKGKIFSVLVLLPAPYLYWWIGSFVDSYIPRTSFIVYLVGVSFLLVAVVSTFYLLFKFTYKNFGSFHPILFFILFGKLGIFVGLLILAEISLLLSA